MTAPTQPRNTGAQPLQRWDPLREIADLHDRLDRLVDPGGVASSVWTPPVDIEETDDAWIVEAELPGVERDDISIELRENELSITGEIKERERTGILRRRTRRVGEFAFHVTLPGPFDPDQVEATMKDGVLSVRVPKPQTSRPRRIEVK
jgi:HSP20 family protein